MTRTPQAAQPSHQTHTFSSSIAQAKRFKWKQLLLSSVCLQRLRTKTLSISKYELKQSGISELWLVTRRAWNHFLVLTDHYPPLSSSPLQKGYRTSSLLRCFQQFSDRTCVHACTCVFTCTSGWCMGSF